MEKTHLLLLVLIFRTKRCVSYTGGYGTCAEFLTEKLATCLKRTKVLVWVGPNSDSGQYGVSTGNLSQKCRGESTIRQVKEPDPLA